MTSMYFQKNRPAALTVLFRFHGMTSYLRAAAAGWLRLNSTQHSVLTIPPDDTDPEDIGTPELQKNSAEFLVGLPNPAIIFQINHWRHWHLLAAIISLQWDIIILRHDHHRSYLPPTEADHRHRLKFVRIGSLQ